jgi:hypothetical protein
MFILVVEIFFPICLHRESTWDSLENSNSNNAQCNTQMDVTITAQFQQLSHLDPW